MKLLRKLLLLSIMIVLFLMGQTIQSYAIEGNSDYINLINGDFEEPVIPSDKNNMMYKEGAVPGWKSTASDKMIELQKTQPDRNITPYSGKQYAELNANFIGALYQDIPTRPFQKIYWSVAHRGRTGIDEASVKFGAPGAVKLIQTMTTGNSEWKVYSGEYIVPENQFKTRFQFEAVKTANGNNSMGNFIDNVVFTSDLPSEDFDLKKYYLNETRTGGYNLNGDTIEYTVKVHSHKNVEAVYDVNDDLPPEVTAPTTISRTYKGIKEELLIANYYDAKQHKIKFNMYMAPNESFSMKYKVRIKESIGQSKAVLNTVKVKSIDFDFKNLDEKIARNILIISGPKDLSLTKVAENLTIPNGKYLPGHNVRYFLTVSNSTATPYYGVELKDQLPVELEKPSAAILLKPDGSFSRVDISTIYDPIKHSLKIDLGILGVGEQSSIIFATKLLPSSSEKSVLNRANVSGISQDFSNFTDIDTLSIIDVGLGKKGTIEVKYQDEAGKQVATAKQLVGNVDEVYNEVPVAVTGYEYSYAVGKTSGVFTEAKQTLIFVYKRKTSTLKVEFKDTEGKIIHDPVILTGGIGEKIDLTKQANVVTVLKQLTDTLLEIEKRPESETAVELVANEKAVYYSFKGKLMIKSAPKRIDFGTHEVSYLPLKLDKPKYDLPLSIWDNRAQTSQWTLTATLSKALTSKVDGGKVIEDAIKYRTKDDKIVTLSTKNAQPIEIHKHTATGEYVISDEWDKGQTGFLIDIPAGAVRKLDEYEAEILWQLGDTR